MMEPVCFEKASGNGKKKGPVVKQHPFLSFKVESIFFPEQANCILLWLFILCIRPLLLEKHFEWYSKA